MALPDVTIKIEDGALGQVPASVANASVKIGVCSAGAVGTVYSFSDTSLLQSTLGQGPLVESMAHTLAVAGGPVYALPVLASTYGTNSSVTKTGPGTGTVTPTLAPAQTTAIKVSTGGVLGTAQIQVALNGGAYSAPVATTAGPFSYVVPGTMTTVTMAAGTYILNDVYTIGTDGAVVLTGSGPAASNVTHTDSPLDSYDIRVTITTAGGLGVGAFTYSTDGGANTSAQIAIPAGGKYAIPNTGVVMTFAGTFTAGDVYAWTTTAASFSGTDVNNAMTTLLGNAAGWGFVHVVGSAANAAASAAVAATVATQMTAAETAYRYVFGVIECPTVESDSTVAAAFASFASTRTMVCAGDVAAISPLTGKVQRRNAAIAITARMALIPPGEAPSEVARGPLPFIRSLYRDERITQLLDAARFATLRTHVGLAGYYVTNGNLMAPGGSDFNRVQRRRVMDVACGAARAGALVYLNDSVRVDKKTGYIDERDAIKIERALTSKLKTAVVDTGDSSDATVVLNRTTNILSGGSQPISVRILPLGYLEFISVSIGFTNPAISTS